MGAKEDQAFIDEWAPFVTNLARKIRSQLDFKGELDDLVGWGFKGLLEARARFDASRGVQFNTFAYYRVRGAILDGVREMAFLPARMHSLRKAAEGADHVLEAAGEARAAATGAPGGPSLEATAQGVDDLLGRLTAAFVLSSLGQGEDDRPETPEDALSTAQVTARVREAVAALPDRERALLEGFYLDGRRFDEVAAELGISKSWASRLHTKALAVLRSRLER